MSISKIDIRKIKTTSELAAFFSVSHEQLQNFLISKDSLVKKGRIIKKSGDYRDIVRVTDEPYRHFLKRIADFLRPLYDLNVPTSVHGFIRGRSIITNAQQHTEKKIVLNVDIKDFFKSISYEMIKKVFTQIGFQNKIAETLTELVTIDRVLATGFSTSPILSNMVCLPMDYAFEKLFEKHKVTYTRYADDITLSSNNHSPSKHEIESIFDNFGFKANEDKYRRYNKGGPQYVTGLTVVDKSPRLPKRFKRLLRLEMYYVKKYGSIQHLNRSLSRSMQRYERPSKLSYAILTGFGLDGLAAYIYSVEKKLGEKLFNLFSNEHNHLS